MEKINFFKFAKISFLALVCSSIALSSCSKDDDSEGGSGVEVNPGENIDLPGDVLKEGDYSVVYPENHTFGVWYWDTVPVRVGDNKAGHDDRFATLLTMDTLAKSVRIMYYALVEPKSVEASDVDGVAKRFVEDVYCEDNGHKLLSDETVTFAGYSNAKKLCASQIWYRENAETVECNIYKERYVFYDKDKKKVYSVVMEMPESLKSKRYKELYGIISSLKINK